MLVVNGAPRFVLRTLAFTGPAVTEKTVRFEDGLNVVWGASNAGKSFTIKALDFMTGARSTLPPITQRQGYEHCWLELDLPRSGRVTLERALAGGSFALHEGSADRAAFLRSNRVLAATHSDRSPSVSSFLLEELGIFNKRIARTLDGATNAFTFRHFAPYLFTEETPMMAETLPIKIDAKTTDTFDKNVLKFLLTGLDDSAVITSIPVRDQKTLNSGRIEIVEEMIETSLGELQEIFPDDDVEALDFIALGDKLSKTVEELAGKVATHQSELDDMRRRRRKAFDHGDEIRAQVADIKVTLENFKLLASVYDSDLERLASLSEGADALLAGARRPCPLCGAEPEHQHETHGLDQVERSRRAAQAEAAKIVSERRDLAKAVSALEEEAPRLQKLIVVRDTEVRILDEAIEKIRPLEAESRQAYEELDQARQRYREAIALKATVESLRSRRDALVAFRPVSRSRDQVVVGVDGSLGAKFAREVQKILDDWHFPGTPTVSFDSRTHDVLIDGKDRRSNGKGVRALMNAAFKLAVLAYCRNNDLPHPGVVALDSPLVTYRDPHTSKHGDLSGDEQEIKYSGVKEGFYRYLLDNSRAAQFIVIENDPPPEVVTRMAHVQRFVGPGGIGGREGLF